MPLLIPFEPGGLEPRTTSALDDIIAALQTWANQVDGVNAAERLASLTSGIAALPTVPTGAIVAWPTGTAPTGYLLCNGLAVSRTTYVTLYMLIGIAYGAGDGSTTFNLPDLRQRFILGTAASGTGSTLAGTGGAIDHTHTGPSHTHTLSGSTANESGHTHTFTTNGDGAVNAFAVDANGGGATVSVNTTAHTHTGTTAGGSAHSHGVGSLAAAAAGTGATGSANPPFLALSYVIKT